MEEPHLLRISFLCALAGLLALFLVSGTIRSPTPVCDISPEDIGTMVMVSGTITLSKTSNNHVFLDISEDNCSIRYVIFNTTAMRMNRSGVSPYRLSTGTRLTAPGVVDEYPKGSGRLELVYRSGDITVY